MASAPASPYTVLDVFTDAPLEGNPVAIFENAAGWDGKLMQRIARELNLSETVFIVDPAPEQSDVDAEIRIFTPAIEMPFAGHPVLGTAFFVGERTGGDTVGLKTRAGVVPIKLTRDQDEIVYGEMDQPLPSVRPYERADELLQALGLARSELPIEIYRNGPEHAYVALENEAAVQAVRPDLKALTDFPIGVSCFATSAPNRVKTRMFSPGMGVAEDPATGSAAGPLALHLARHGRTQFGQEIEIRQGAEIGRPSLLKARVEGSPDKVERVVVGGSAVVVARGEFLLR